MRLCALVLVVLGLAIPSLALSATHQPAGALSVEGGKGIVTVKGNGGLLGRVGKGSLDIVDLSTADPWRPTVNGVTRPRHFFVKGANITFRILGGDYRVTVRGDGISLSGRGAGTATLLGLPGITGVTGLYSVDLNADCQGEPDGCTPIPFVVTRVPFGGSSDQNSAPSK